ncbi:hypothetical protein HWV62_9903 [Athelia sp. TMB]|nr:hypothetical protein HWV62_9903 [Athelia sp. TMB]
MAPLAETSIQISEQPPAVAIADALTAAGSTVTALAQSDLVGQLQTLMSSLDWVVAIGNKVATIHPWANLAWSVLSIGLQVVQKQQNLDNKILSLIQTMQSTYSIVAGSGTVEDKQQQDVLCRILKQTIDCGFFIREYARPRSFAHKAITEVFSRTDALVTQYQSTFKQLQDEFHGRITTKTALMTVDIALATAQVAAAVKEIRFDQLLEKLRPVEMDQSARDICLPGTQLTKIKSVMDWYSDDAGERAMWLYGMAGAGKSTLSNTIARMMDSTNELNLLGAFFFFDRNIAQRNSSTLIRTIAYQLAEFDPIIGARIQEIITKIPGIAQKSLDTQFTKLLSAEALGDLPWFKGPILIIVDALDESGTATERQRLMRVLSEGVSKLPRFVRLLLLSRRERDLLECYDHPILRRDELQVNGETGRSDIALFIRARLDDTRKRHHPFLGEALKSWPRDRDIDALVNLASGHFIWAHIACRIIDEANNPKGKLEDLISHQSMVTSGDSFKSLYQLYAMALDSAIQWNDHESRDHARDLLSAVICAQEPLTYPAIDDLLAQEVTILQVVSRLGSVLDWSRTGPIRIIHKSFHDYLTLHSLAQPWALDIDECNLQLATGSITLLERELQENICGLVLPHPVKDETLPEATSYAARSWIQHVYLTKNPSPDFGDKIEQFIRKHLLHWMEAQSIIGARGPFEGHSSTVRSISFSPDGLKIVSGSEDKTVRVWDRQIGETTLLLEGHRGTVNSVAFSPDGLKIVSGSNDGTVRVWDGLTGLPALLIEGYRGAVNSVAFSPDGFKIISGSNDSTVQMWDGLTGQLALLLEGHTDTVLSASFSPDGSKIVSGSEDETVQVWDGLTGQPALLIKGHRSAVNSVAFSPDGLKIVSGSGDGTVRIWNGLTGQLALPTLEGHEGAVSSVAFSPDGLSIASASFDRTVRVWESLVEQPALPLLEGHTDTVLSVSFSPDGSKIVSGSEDKTVRVWDGRTGQSALPPLEGHKGPVHSVSFSPDGSTITSESSDGTVLEWDAYTGRLQEEGIGSIRPLLSVIDNTTQARSPLVVAHRE